MHTIARKRRDAGFTLPEVMVSLLIAAASLLAISSLVVMSTRNTSKSRQMTSALSLAQGLADSIRSVRTQDRATVPWQLTTLTGANFLPDPTNPNPDAYDRYYRIDVPPEVAGRSLANTLQVTIRVRPRGYAADGGALAGASEVKGQVYGWQHGMRTTDLIFLIQDPNYDPYTGTGGLNP